MFDKEEMLRLAGERYVTFCTKKGTFKCNHDAIKMMQLSEEYYREMKKKK